MVVQINTGGFPWRWWGAMEANSQPPPRGHSLCYHQPLPFVPNHSSALWAKFHISPLISHSCYQWVAPLTRFYLCCYFQSGCTPVFSWPFAITTHLLLPWPLPDVSYCNEQVEIKLPLAWDGLKREHLFRKWEESHVQAGQLEVQWWEVTREYVLSI